MKTKTFQELKVWKKAHQLVLKIYKITKSFPVEERYGLSSQMRRAAVSVPANIAEGYKKRGKADKLRFYNIAQSSLEEVRYFLILIADLGYAETKQIKYELEEVSRFLNVYYEKIRNSMH